MSNEQFQLSENKYALQVFFLSNVAFIAIYKRFLYKVGHVVVQLMHIHVKILMHESMYIRAEITNNIMTNNSPFEFVFEEVCLDFVKVPICIYVFADSPF